MPEKLDGFDAAIIGRDADTSAFIYSKGKILELLMEVQDFDRNEANEYLHYNIIGSSKGTQSPIILEEVNNYE